MANIEWNEVIGGHLMQVSLTDQALEHIRNKGGQAAIDLICVSN